MKAEEKWQSAHPNAACMPNKEEANAPQRNRKKPAQRRPPQREITTAVEGLRLIPL